MQKIKLEDVAIEVAEFGIDSFSKETVPMEDLKNVFQRVKFGEITLKIVNGEIESMQVVHNYKPIRFDKDGEIVYTNIDEL